MLYHLGVHIPSDSVSRYSFEDIAFTLWLAQMETPGFRNNLFLEIVKQHKII